MYIIGIITIFDGKILIRGKLLVDPVRIYDRKSKNNIKREKPSLLILSYLKNQNLHFMAFEFGAVACNYVRHHVVT
jgi:hypothetical protein